MLRRLHILLVSIIFAGSVLGMIFPAIAQNVSPALPAAPPSDSDLDALLEAKDWNRLSAALKQPKDAASVARILNWLHAKVDDGAGFMVAYAYMRNLWVVGNALNENDPRTDLRVTGGMIALYTYELTVIDGAKCDDQSAPGNRASQLIRFNPAILSFLKSRPTELKTNIVDIAVALEKKTAPLRKYDDLICRDGLDQFRAAVERGTQQEVANTSGHFGKTVAVTPPSDWTPKFVPLEIYIPRQEKARAAIRERLLKLLE